MINLDEIATRIEAIIAEYLEIDKSLVTAESVLGEIGADSLETIEIIMTIEKEFNIRIPDDAISGLETVQDFVLCVEKHLNTPS